MLQEKFYHSGEDTTRQFQVAIVRIEVGDDVQDAYLRHALRIVVSHIIRLDVDLSGVFDLASQRVPIVKGGIHELT